MILKLNSWELKQRQCDIDGMGKRNFSLEQMLPGAKVMAQ
jgi:hypothetical protein